MSAHGNSLQQLAAQAMQLSRQERGELVHRVLVSLEDTATESLDAIASAWDAEIAQRVADMDVGLAQWTPADRVVTQIRARI